MMMDRDGFEVVDEELSADPMLAYPPLPRKLFQEMIRRGVVNAKVTPEQDAGLKMLQWAWQDKQKLFFRFMAASIRKRDREKMVMFPHLAQHEKGIVSMFLNAAKNRNNDDISLVKNKRITTVSIQKMVKENCGYDITTKKVRQLRQIAYNYRRESASNEKRVALDNSKI